MCVCVGERESVWESMCVCVCVCERECLVCGIERDNVCVVCVRECVLIWGLKGYYACVCVLISKCSQLHTDVLCCVDPGWITLVWDCCWGPIRSGGWSRHTLGRTQSLRDSTSQGSWKWSSPPRSDSIHHILFYTVWETVCLCVCVCLCLCERVCLCVCVIERELVCEE